MISYNCNKQSNITFTTKGDIMEKVGNQKELNSYEEKKIAIKYWLQGKAENDPAYYNVLKSLDKIMRYSDEFDGDNMSAHFSRQVELMKNKISLGSQEDVEDDFVNSDSELNNYQKKKLAIKFWLIGKSEDDQSYCNCVKAMELAVRYHNGFRKDHVTPEFQHQIEIISNIRTSVKDLMRPADTITVAFLHDVVEDYGINAKYWTTQKDRLVGLKPVKLEFIESHFGKDVADAVNKISKMADGVTKGKEEYFQGISECPMASIAKLEDRCNNMDSMLNVFTLEKQINYAREVVEYFLPMLKKANKNFPEQESAYMRFKNVLTSQVKGVNNMAAIFDAEDMDIKQVPIVAAQERRKKRMGA